MDVLHYPAVAVLGVQGGDFDGAGTVPGTRLAVTGMVSFFRSSSKRTSCACSLRAQRHGRR